MFKIKPLAAIVVMMLTTSLSYADLYDDTSFNFGGEISVLNRTSYNDGASLNEFKTANGGKLAISKNKPGFNIFIGMRFNQYLGMEAGFGFIQKATANVENNQQATNKISNIYGDFLGYLNIAPQVDLLGSVGIGGLKSSASVTNTTIIGLNSLNKQKAGWRFGGGLQYNFTELWSSRVVLRWQKGNPNFLQSLFSVSVGILYTFSC